MKFRFVGGLDCPDWLLAEIAQFTKITPANFRVWCKTVADRLKSKQLEWKEAEVEKLRGESTELDMRGVKGAIAALGFIIEKAAKNECSPEDLEKEMLQSGMPAEHAKQLHAVYKEENEELTRSLSASFIREPSLSVLSHKTQEVNGVLVHKLECLTSDGQHVNFAMEDGKFQAFRSELERALDTLTPYCK